VVANYTEVTGLLHDSSGRTCGARLRPAVPVPGAPAEPELEVQARVVVNATGVWADEVRALDEGTHPHSIRPAKGIHVTVPRSRLPADIAAVVPVPGDRRSVFVVPWPDGDDVYIGTTDTDWDGPLDDPACLPEDVDYVLGAVNHVVTEPLGRDDVTGVWAGLRPLLSPAGGRHVSARTADMSRRHLVRVSDGGVVTVTGGKLTTYRQMAEDAVDAALTQLGTSAGARPCRTRRMELRGAAGIEQLRGPGVAASLGVDETALAALVARHGSETADVLLMADGRPELLEPLVPGMAQLRVEALWAVRQEMAHTLDDVLARRTRALLRRGGAAAGEAAGIAALLADDLGRPPAALTEEAQALGRAVARQLQQAGLGGHDPDGSEATTAPGAHRLSPEGRPG
jgi:glycerol-3-phosphate dehydrogenase